MPQVLLAQPPLERIDSSVDLLQVHGASVVMSGERQPPAGRSSSCHRHGGFSVGSVLAARRPFWHRAASRAWNALAYPEELGMEAIWKIEVEDFPAFILVDDKGNDFFQQIVNKQCANCTK
ncbi:fumarate hydratase C-terminal domain-containing protein [Shigella flexneri]